MSQIPSRKPARRSRHSDKLCKYCGDPLTVETSRLASPGVREVNLACKTCGKRWKTHEPLAGIAHYCRWEWGHTSYERHVLAFYVDGWPVDIQRRVLCVRRCYATNNEPEGWYAVTPDGEYLAKLEPQSSGPLESLIADLFNEKLDQLRENDTALIPRQRRTKRR